MTDADDESSRRVSRRSVLASTGGLLATLVAPATATTVDSAAVRDDDALTLAAVEAASDPRVRAEGLAELHESAGEPTWVVSYAEGELSSLEEWASGDEAREILDAYTHEASRTTVVRASTADVGATLIARITGSGLASRSYIETVDANPVLSLAEPVELRSQSEAFPEYGAVESQLRFGGEAPVADGLAFDDVETAPMGDVASVVNADGLSDSPTVAVVDTGLNTTSSGDVFGDRVLGASKNMLTGETVSDAGLEALSDGNGHGTFVSAQAVGDPPDSSHTGILPSGQLLAIRALDDEGSGATSDIARGWRYAVDNGADAVILSLGSPAWSHELDRAAAYANGAGVVSVVAVGNDRYGSRWVASPASSSRAIAVASTTTGLGEEPIRSSYYSNVGPHPGSTDLSGGESTDASPDVAAPGHAIETTVPTESGSLTTARKSGTSMSAPIVGAIVAALGGTDVETVRTTLQEAAEPITDAAEAEVGAGLVDGSRTISGGESSETQSDAMDEDATARDEAYRTESDSRGRALLEWF